MNTTVEKKQVNEVEGKKEQKCFWELVEVDAEGNFIVKVYNEAKQKELNNLVGQAKAKYTRERNKIMKQDDNYAELIEILGFEATIEMFSTAGKAYVYNVKREMAKDVKAEQNKEALLEGARAARAARTTERKERVTTPAIVITEQGEW
jgi:hypothetical protein